MLPLQILSLADRLPQAMQIYQMLQQAKAGDPYALARIKDGGWADVLNLVSPGSGETARQTLDRVLQVLQDARLLPAGLAGLDEAEYRMRQPPWAAFGRDLVRRPYGGHIILGPYGQGKTSLAKKLASNWANEHSYKIECVSMYRSDLPPGAVTITTGTLVNRMAMLQAYLDSQGVLDPEDWQVEGEESEVPAKLPPQRRVIVIDEASLSLSVSPTDPVRNAALAALANCRHVDWHVVFIGQQASQIPPKLFSQATVWVKRPAGKEVYTDRQDQATRDLWSSAMGGFERLQASPWYLPPYDTPKAWAYVDSPASDTGSPYAGMICFSPVGYRPAEYELDSSTEEE